MSDHATDWQRLQQEFLAQWMGAGASAPWQSLQDVFTAGADAARGAPGDAAPWQSFKLFAELLGEQAQQLREGRKRRVDVAAALKALLENLVRGIDAAIALQAIAAGDKAMGAAPFDFNPAFASWPALGLTREWQRRLQRCWQALAADREAGAHLRTLQWRALRGGCERCSRALSAPGPAITSLRGLYDLLVDQVEAAWRETAMTDEYARAFGASVNATLALRNAVRDCMQPLTGLLELAGRAELEAIERRLRALESTPVGTAKTATATAPEVAAAPSVERSPVAVTPPPAATKAVARKPRRRREPEPPRAKPAKKPAAPRVEFDIASVMPRGDGKS